uniref:Polycystin domain-containing protein n=2 Tax=Lygus hesperus TaxID=30085 RepID=A0A0K8TDX4_LYGHE
MSSSGDTESRKGAIPRTAKLEEPTLLSAGEIDVRYLKLLILRGKNAMANYYGMRRRFRGNEYGPPPIIDERDTDATTASEQAGDSELSSSADGLEPEERSGGFGTAGGGGRGYFRPGPKLGALSRKILHPEYPERDQPHKMKKDKKKKSAEESKGADSSIWGTSDMYGNTVDHEAYVEHAMRDFVLYVIFLVIANMITFGVLDHAYNYYANTLSDIITNTPFETPLGMTKTFNEIRNVQQIWDFITKVLLGVLYEYGSDHARTIRMGKKDDVLVLFENILIGVPRIRQHRVRNDSCRTSTFFKDLFSTCYNYYSDEQQDREPFGMKQPTAWVYAEPDADSAHYNGKISSYGGGGYMMNITNDKVYTKNWIQELIDYEWIQQGTRVVFIDFTTYTPNTNLFCVVKLVFELPPQEG